MCPPGVDQTMRSSQVWHVIAPELLESHEIDSQEERWSYSGTLKQKLFNPKINWDAWGKLALPSLVSSTMRSQLYSACLPIANAKPSLLEKLSNELLDMIFEYLAPEKADLVALGLSSQYLWQLILHHIHEGYFKSAAPWAGKMIVFQGSYSTDLPEAFTDNGFVESITGKSWFGRMCAARRFFWASRQDRQDIKSTPYSEEAAWRIAALSHRDSSAIPENCWWTIEEELGCSYLFPKNQEWLLRNLTTRETVSSKALNRSETRKTRSGQFQSISFDDVLLIKTCWTNIPSDDEDEDLNIHRGEWAGHRFDIVTFDTHKTDEKLGEWSDVSGRILKEASRIRGLLS